MDNISHIATTIYKQRRHTLERRIQVTGNANDPSEQSRQQGFSAKYATIWPATTIHDVQLLSLPKVDKIHSGLLLVWFDSSSWSLSFSLPFFFPHFLVV